MIEILCNLKKSIKSWAAKIILLFFLSKRNRLTKMKKSKSKISLPELHSEILDLFGYPVSSMDCLCKRDKIIYVYGYMMVVKATDDEPEILSNCMFDKNPALYFCSHYYEKHGKHVISDDISEAALVVPAEKLEKK